MAYYDPPPFRSHKPSRRRDSFTTPPFRHNAGFNPQEPQYGDDYPRGRAHSPIRTPGGMPRTRRVSPGKDTSPTRSSSPPSFYTEQNSYYDTPKYRAAHAKEALYDEYDVPSSPPPSFHAEKGSYYDTPKSRAAHARQAEYDEYDVPSSPPPSFHAEKGSYYDTPKARAAHSHSHSHSKSQSQPKPPPSSSSFPPPPPLIDTTPTPYTYDDEEPDRIPIAPNAWNNYSASASKEELIIFFVDQGIHPKRAAAAVDREFAAYAPQHMAGQKEPGLPRAQIPASDTNAPPPRRREESGSGSGSGSGHRSARTRRHSPPPSAYRSPSPVPGNGSRHRSSSSSGSASGSSGSGSSSRHRAHSPPRRTASRKEGERSGEKRERKEKKGDGMTPPRAPSPPRAATRGEAEGLRRHRSEREKV
ncbi:hypothetical protein DL98DRAFT_567767 [Cadophora sp. DSE1049]|nr:hypothetical protein DL98DRAFT_567767 [Cadophora sp. DSE1049]